MVNKVVPFPTKMKNRVRHNKAANVLSIASLLVLSMFTNQWLVNNRQTDTIEKISASRGIASINPKNSIYEETIENELIKKVANEETVAVGEKPNDRDELIYGVLEGKYGMSILNGKIDSIDLIDQSGADIAVKIENKEQFLKKYKTSLAIDFDQIAELDSENLAQQRQVASQTNRPIMVQRFSLLDKSKIKVGEVSFHMDAEGRLISFKLSR